MAAIPVRLPEPNDRLVVVSTKGTLGVCDELIGSAPCNKDIYLKVCRGVSRPEHAGMHYEAVSLLYLVK